MPLNPEHRMWAFLAVVSAALGASVSTLVQLKTDGKELFDCAQVSEDFETLVALSVLALFSVTAVVAGYAALVPLMAEQFERHSFTFRSSTYRASMWAILVMIWGMLFLVVGICPQIGGPLPLFASLVILATFAHLATRQGFRELQARERSRVDLPRIDR